MKTIPEQSTTSPGDSPSTSVWLRRSLIARTVLFWMIIGAIIIFGLAACRRERNSSHASRSANARVVQSTGKSARRERGRRQNRDRDGGPMTWKDATTLALRPE